MPETVPLDLLCRAFYNIIDHLKEQGIDAVELRKDFYWRIDSEALYELKVPEPNQLSVGQLYDDLDWIRDQDSPIGWQLVPLSSILRYIGEMYKK